MELNNNQQENEQMPTQLQPQVIYRAVGWVAVIAGQMGEKMDSGFVLKEPNIQVFERKSKEALEPTTVATSVASAVEHP